MVRLNSLLLRRRESRWSQAVKPRTARCSSHRYGANEITRDPAKVRKAIPLWYGDRNLVEEVTLQRIRGPVHYAYKEESRPLQLADTCAFFIRGNLCGHWRAEQFYRELEYKMQVW